LKDLADGLDDDTFQLVDGGDGVPTWVRGGAKRTLTTKVPDDELTWEQVQVAVMRFLAALTLAGWPRDRQSMFAEFFAGIQMHPWRTSIDIDGIKSQALLIYMEERRRLWHQYLELGVSDAPDLSIINEEALRRAKDEAYDRHRRRVDQVHQRVSNRKGSLQPWSE
jgi:hypothetical protein